MHKIGGVRNSHMHISRGLMEYQYRMKLHILRGLNITFGVRKADRKPQHSFAQYEGFKYCKDCTILGV